MIVFSLKDCLSNDIYRSLDESFFLVLLKSVQYTICVSMCITSVYYIKVGIYTEIHKQAHVPVSM